MYAKKCYVFFTIVNTKNKNQKVKESIKIKKGMKKMKKKKKQKEKIITELNKIERKQKKQKNLSSPLLGRLDSDERGTIFAL